MAIFSMSVRASLSVQNLRVIRVFLASPGDLVDERRAARDAIEEVNRIYAHPSGFQVQLVGWEDTLPGMGRPQAIINEDLKTCQMFIGMIWTRWGSSSDTQGRFTSGFQEEFTLATELHAQQGKPHIALFFKAIDPAKLVDIGPQLQKVLDFKKQIIEQKIMLFEEFFDANAFAAKVRINVTEYLTRLKSELAEAELRIKSERIVSDSSVQRGRKKNSSSKEGQQNDTIEGRFLIDVGEILCVEEGEGLSAVQIARLKNIAIALSRPTNDSTTLNVHDANIMFLNKSEFTLSDQEVTGLIDAGLSNLSSETAPLWSWLESRLKKSPSWLSFATLFGSDSRRIGALRAMGMLKLPLEESSGFSVAEIATYWFDDDVHVNVKLAALNYISIIKSEVYIPFVIREIEKNNFQTRGLSHNTLLKITAVNSLRKAAELALNNPTEDFDAKTFAIFANGFEEMNNEVLLSTFDHRSGLVRSAGLRILSERRALSLAQAKRFFGDSSIDVRRIAVKAAKRLGVDLTNDELKAALVLDKVPARGLFVGSDFDFEGSTEYEHEKHLRLSQATFEYLSSRFERESFDKIYHYLAIAQGHFKNVADQFRSDFDDRFARVWDEHLSAIKSIFSDQNDEVVVNTIQQTREFYIRRHLRTGLDIITQQSDASDLPRLRKALDEDAIDPRIADIDFFQNCGAWEDIKRIAAIAGDYRTKPGSTMMSSNYESFKLGALAIIRLSEGRFVDLIRLDLPVNVLTEVIRFVPVGEMRKIPSLELMTLLSNEAEELRKVTVLQILRCMSAKGAREVLSQYINLDSRMFYNVVFWLDIASALRKSAYMKIVEVELFSKM